MGATQIGLREGDENCAFFVAGAKSIFRISRVIRRAASRLPRAPAAPSNVNRATDSGRLRSADSAATLSEIAPEGLPRVSKPVSGSNMPSVSSDLSMRLSRASNARMRTRGTMRATSRAGSAAT